VSAATRVSREYVWGPGDCYAGIDELVAQFDGESRQTPWWALQDLSGDVVALVYKPANAAAAVAWQCTYEPYGGVLAEVSHVEHPRVHLGHKGLFVENLDSLEFTALEPDLQPRLAAQRPLLYHVRNRSMLAGEPVDEEGNARVWAGGLGRFLQPDPNATGVGVQSSVAFHGRGDLSILFDVGLTAWTNDGLHAVGYLRCSPMMHGDPLGLSLIDPLVTGGDDAAARAAQLQLIRSFGGASGLLARILSPAFAANAARAGSLGAGYLVLRFSWQQSQDYGAGAEGRNPAQDKMLTRGEIERLKDAGHDPHEMKPHPASRYDLYKDKDGNIYVKPKGGSGAGEPTNININHV